MANPFVFGAAGFASYEDATFPGQAFGGFDDVLMDSTMPYIDLSPSSSTAYALFAANLATPAPNHTPLRPTLGIPPVPPPSHKRFASPISSIGLSTARALSPLAETESHFDGYDSFPRTPPDTALRSPFHAPLVLDPFSTAHAHQFASMGTNFVKPSDVNPVLQSEYSESDNGTIDFLAHPVYSFDSYAVHTAHHDVEPAQSAMELSFAVRQSGPQQPPSRIQEEIEVPTQYPPLKEEDTGSDDEASFKRPADDDADGEYQPSKRQRASTRPARRAAVKPAAPSPARPRRKGANNPAPTFRTLPAAASRTHLACPTCSKSTFTSQADLDAHIKKQHPLRAFNCVFDFAGCETTFAKKNEWKRHVATQHLLLNYWRCPEGACAHSPEESPSHTHTHTPPPNGSIFNRKDLFTQHLKRMHAPKEIKDLLHPTPTSTSTKKPKHTPAQAALLATWDLHVRTLQSTAVHPRCALPTRMRCPVPGCAEPAFCGADAWDQRMEHVARHMEAFHHPPSSSSATGKAAAAAGKNNNNKKVVFGGAGDVTLVEWASRADVAIIEPAEEGWVLKSPLKRGPGGCVVVTAPVLQQQQQQQTRPEPGGEIVVWGGGEEDDDEEGEEEEEVDAEGEEDD